MVLPVQRRLPSAGPVTGYSGYADGSAAAWLGRADGLRNTVAVELVARQLAEQLAYYYDPLTPLRVLDAACGTGVQAVRLARLGHFVTALDTDPGALAAAQQTLAAEPEHVQARISLLTGDGGECGRWFGPSSFDTVLCHGVLMYLADPEPLLASLARVLAPGGLMSVVVRNGDALAMRAGLSGDWASALAGLRPPQGAQRQEGPRADRRDDLARTLAELHVPLHDWYGVRVFTDNAPDSAPLPPPQQLAALLDAEELAGRHDPYRGVGAMLHLIGRKP